MHKALVMGIALAAWCGGQQNSQEKFKAYYAQVVRFREQAKAAYDREMAREKAGDCPQADNTRAIVDCQGKEIATTVLNYQAYAGALRSLLGIMGGDENDPIGPTGKPLTSKELISEFDAAEAAWEKYREAQITAAFDQFKGGTAAGPHSGAIELMLIRSHMREVEAVYSVRLHN